MTLKLTDDHTADHNYMRDGILKEAARLSTTVDIGGPYKVGDPAHIQEHNRTTAALQLLADLVDAPVQLPPIRQLGDTGHIADHLAWEQALAVIQSKEGWNVAEGGTVTEYSDDRGFRWRVHTFTDSAQLTVKTSIRPFRVLLIGGGGGGSCGGGDIRSGWGGGGSGGAAVEQSLKLAAGTLPVEVGAGGAHQNAYEGSTANNGTYGSPSRFAGLEAAGGRGGLRNTPGDGPTATSDITGTPVVYGSPGCSNCCHTGQGRHSEGVNGLGSGGGGQEQGQNTSACFGCQGGSGVVIVSYEIGTA